MSNDNLSIRENWKLIKEKIAALKSMPENDVCYKNTLAEVRAAMMENEAWYAQYKEEAVEPPAGLFEKIMARVNAEKN